MKKLLTRLKALGDSNRLRIVAALIEEDELCACQITELLQVTGATVSRHLSILVNSGILKSRKEGRWIFYKLNKKDIVLLEWLKNNLEGSSEFNKDRKNIKKITSCPPEEICRKQRGTDCC